MCCLNYILCNLFLHPTEFDGIHYMFCLITLALCRFTVGDSLKGDVIAKENSSTIIQSVEAHARPDGEYLSYASFNVGKSSVCNQKGIKDR